MYIKAIILRYYSHLTCMRVACVSVCMVVYRAKVPKLILDIKFSA